MQGQDYVILVWPCVENGILLHCLEEVTEQLDLKLSKSKPRSIIHICYTKYTEPTTSFSIHRKIAQE